MRSVCACKKKRKKRSEPRWKKKRKLRGTSWRPKLQSRGSKWNKRPSSDGRSERRPNLNAKDLRKNKLARRTSTRKSWSV